MCKGNSDLSGTQSKGYGCVRATLILVEHSGTQRGMDV